MGPTPVKDGRPGLGPLMGWRAVSGAILRAVFITVVWLVLFLATFLGYLTIPVALLVAFFVVQLATGFRPLQRLRRWLSSWGRSQ